MTLEQVGLGRRALEDVGAQAQPLGQLVLENQVRLVDLADPLLHFHVEVLADLLTDRLGINLPADRDYSTVAGFALWVLKHLPETGETFKHDGWKFEIVDLDGRKIDKLIASRPRRRAAENEAATTA